MMFSEGVTGERHGQGGEDESRWARGCALAWALTLGAAAGGLLGFLAGEWIDAGPEVAGSFLGMLAGAGAVWACLWRAKGLGGARRWWVMLWLWLGVAGVQWALLMGMTHGMTHGWTDWWEVGFGMMASLVGWGVFAVVALGPALWFWKEEESGRERGDG